MTLSEHPSLNQSRWHVVPSTPQDATVLGELQCAAWQQRLADHAPADFIARFIPAEQAAKYAQRMSSGSHQLLQIQQSDVVLGFTALTFNTHEPTDYTHELSAFYITPDREGEGAGTYLLKQTLAEARRQQIASLVVWTFASNQHARHVYAKCGATFLFETANPPGMELKTPHACYGWRF